MGIKRSRWALEVEWPTKWYNVEVHLVQEAEAGIPSKGERRSMPLVLGQPEKIMYVPAWWNA